MMKFCPNRYRYQLRGKRSGFLEFTKEFETMGWGSFFLLLLYSVFQYAVTMTTVKMGKVYNYVVLCN
jgi:hypothetical protein